LLRKGKHLFASRAVRQGGWNEARKRSVMRNFSPIGASSY